MPPKIGMVLIGHPDYPNDIGLQFAQEAAESLRARGSEVRFEPVALTRPLEARAAGIRAAAEDPDGVVVFLGTWIECPTALQAIREFEHLPFAVWGHNMFPWQGKRESTGSFVAAAVLKGALERMEYRAETIIGLPSDERAQAQAAVFCRAAHAVKRLRRTRIALVGYAAMGMYAGTFDHARLRRHVGPEVEHLDTYSLIRMAEAAPEEAVQRAAEDLRAKAEIRVEPDRLLKAARLAAGLRALLHEGAFDAVNVKCQYELSQQYGMTPCVPLSLIADEGGVAGCEGDLLTTVTQGLLRYLADETPYYGDILDLNGRRMLLSSCGFAPFGLCNPDETPCVCELGYPGFDGIISSFTLRRGPVTFARLAEGARADHRLNYGTGVGVETDLRQGRFPALEIELDGDPDLLWGTIASQHFALCYGDVSAEIEAVCRHLNITACRV